MREAHRLIKTGKAKGKIVVEGFQARVGNAFKRWVAEHFQPDITLRRHSMNDSFIRSADLC